MSVERPKDTPSVQSIALPAWIITVLSMKPKPTIGSADAMKCRLSCSAVSSSVFALELQCLLPTRRLLPTRWAAASRARSGVRVESMRVGERGPNADPPGPMPAKNFAKDLRRKYCEEKSGGAPSESQSQPLRPLC